jgi:hypothetical protein
MAEIIAPVLEEPEDQVDTEVAKVELLDRVDKGQAVEVSESQ